MHDTRQLCIISSMATVAIVGASGYTGQETLDRVLTHPALELYALGSDSLAGQAADALDPRLGRNGWSRIPRFITNDAALSCGADVTFVCLSHGTPRELVATARGSHRRSVWRASFCRRRLCIRPGMGSSTRAERSRALVVRTARSQSRRSGRLIANPGCYATAALLALAPLADEIAARRSRRRCQVRDDRRGPFAGRVLARGRRARERDPVSSWRAPARSGDCVAPRLSRHLRPAPSPGAPWPAWRRAS